MELTNKQIPSLCLKISLTIKNQLVRNYKRACITGVYILPHPTYWPNWSRLSWSHPIGTILSGRYTGVYILPHTTYCIAPMGADCRGHSPWELYSQVNRVGTNICMYICPFRNYTVSFAMLYSPIKKFTIRYTVYTGLNNV